MDGPVQVDIVLLGRGNTLEPVEQRLRIGILRVIELHFMFDGAIFESKGFLAHIGNFETGLDLMVEVAELLREREDFGRLGFGELELQGLIVIDGLFVQRLAGFVDYDDRVFGAGALEVFGECDDGLGGCGGGER